MLWVAVGLILRNAWVRFGSDIGRRRTPDRPPGSCSWTASRCPWASAPMTPTPSPASTAGGTSCTPSGHEVLARRVGGDGRTGERGRGGGAVAGPSARGRGCVRGRELRGQPGVRRGRDDRLRVAGQRRSQSHRRGGTGTRARTGCGPCAWSPTGSGGTCTGPGPTSSAGSGTWARSGAGSDPCPTGYDGSDGSPAGCGASSASSPRASSTANTTTDV